MISREEVLISIRHKTYINFIRRFFMRYLAPALLGVVLVPFFAAPAQAEAEKFLLDKPHTQVVFSINHLGVANSMGKFLDYEGVIMFDQAEPQKSSVDVTVKTASLDMGDAKWDEHMKSKDFFNVEQFPDMKFKSTAIEVTGEKTANITGDLTILGVTKPVVLATTFIATAPHPMMQRTEAGFSATTKIKRSDFGMTYGVPMVGDEVSIILEVEAYKDNPDAPKK